MLQRRQAGRRRRGFALAAGAVLLLGAACSASVVGTASPPSGPLVDLGAVAVRLVPVAALEQPIAFAPFGPDGVLIAQRTGAVHRFDRVGGGLAARGDLLDLRGEVSTGGERGLLGVATAPDGSAVYVSYTDLGGDVRVEEFRQPGNERRNLLTIEHSQFSNHNGGQLAFGPDGLLYLGVGDGGGGGDPLGSGQNPFSLLGKILRIDPFGPQLVPAGNPFASGELGAPEVWLSGVRNPWRFSFDRASGDLWAADVGQDAYEEINRLPSPLRGFGLNLGWDAFEGRRRFDPSTPAPERHVPPLFEYGRDAGCSVTGGFVYRGGAIPALRGAYVYGDWCRGELRGLSLDASGGVGDERGLGASVPARSLVSFGEDAAGELYVLSMAEGLVYLVAPA